MINRTELRYIPIEVATSMGHFEELQGKIVEGDGPPVCGVSATLMLDAIGTDKAEYISNIIGRRSHEQLTKDRYIRDCVRDRLQTFPHFAGGVFNVGSTKLHDAVKWHSDDMGLKDNSVQHNLHLQLRIESVARRRIFFVNTITSLGRLYPRFLVDPPIEIMLKPEVYYAEIGMGSGTYWVEGANAGNGLRTAHCFTGAGVWSYIAGYPKNNVKGQQGAGGVGN